MQQALGAERLPDRDDEKGHKAQKVHLEGQTEAR